MTRGELLFRGEQSARRRIKGVTDGNAKKQKQETATSDQTGGGRGRRHTVGLHVCEQPPGAGGQRVEGWDVEREREERRCGRIESTWS